MPETIDSIVATYEELDLDGCPSCGGDHSLSVTLTFDPATGKSDAVWTCEGTAHHG